MTNLQLEQLIEPRLNIRSENRYFALRGADDLMYTTYWAPNPNTSFITFTDTRPPNGKNMIIGRKMYMTWEMKLTFTAAAGENTNNILQPLTDGVRAFPISSCIQTAEIIFNGVPINVSGLRDNIHARAHYFDHEARSLAISPSASAMLDWTQDYRDSYASINNPLGTWTDSGLFAGKCRGVISGLQILSNTPTNAEIQFSITEPLFIFPFQFATNENELGMSGIQNMTFNFNIVQRNRVWCHDFINGSAIDTMNVECLRAALHINFINPPSDFVFPPVCVLPYNDFKPFNIRNLGGPLNPGQSRDVNSGVLALSTCPQYLLIYAKMANDVRDSSLQNQIGTPDCFAQIERVRLNYGARTDLLAQVEPIQLYEICVSNGLNMDWQEFRGSVNRGFDIDAITGNAAQIGLTGSVVKLMMSKDVVAGPNFIPGMGTNTQLQIWTTIRNPNPYVAIDYELWVFAVNEGVLSFDGKTAIPATTVIPSPEIVRTAPVSAHDYTSSERAFGKALNEGGNFLSILGNIASAIPIVGNVVKGIGSIFNPPTQAMPVQSVPRPLMPRRIAPGSARAGPAQRRIGRSVMGHALEGGELASPYQLGAVSRIY